jgi:hypothetical protein
MNTAPSPAVTCWHCRLPVEEAERRVISLSRGMYAHLSPACCAIATIRAASSPSPETV